MKSNIRVVELFAGVGGFRLGLEQSSPRYQTIWANQWEPSRKVQHAFHCYEHHFGTSKNHSNQDITIVKNQVPAHDLLVGGFPCQDYSVARTGAKGLQGKKGVLWWDIYDIIAAKKPSYVLLENVDRLLRSPSRQRGRDFGVMLRCFYEKGYHVEWRVINAADYGHPQRRRRVFVIAYHKNSPLAEQLCYKEKSGDQCSASFLNDGFFSKKFPLEVAGKEPVHTANLSNKMFADLAKVSDHFEFHFFNAGFMKEGSIFSYDTQAKNKKTISLGDIRHTTEVKPRYFLGKDTSRWEYLKGAKKIKRKRPNGETYYYSEGNMVFPDPIDRPARTILTSESSVSRSSHVIIDARTKKLRRLTPEECEKLNGFPEGWTATGMPHNFRYFVMGNALVVPVVRDIGKTLSQLL